MGLFLDELAQERNHKKHKRHIRIGSFVLLVLFVVPSLFVRVRLLWLFPVAGHPVLLYFPRRFANEEALMRLGVPELLLVGLLVLFFFGGRRLPEMGKGIGEGIKNFKKSIKGDEAGEKEKHA